jgi:beta-phosphoglucomutase-like phosphatase (HAD superfamily)
VADLRALIFDFDGTIAETERFGHRVAYNEAFEELGLPERWDEATYGSWLHVAGGRERLEA